MNDDELRRVLNDEADRVEIGDDSWSRIESRVAARRSAERSPIHSALRPAIAIILAAALLGGALFALGDRGGPDHLTVGGNRSDPPTRIVAITSDGWLVQLDARTGRELRRYLSKPVPGTSIAVSPDGRSFYFTSGKGKNCRDRTIETRSIEAGRGSAMIVATGASQPAISPDGRYLAYYRCRQGDRHPEELVLRDLASGSERMLRPPGKPEVYFGQRLAFESDSSHAVIELVERAAAPSTDAPSRLYQLDLVGGGELPGVPFGLAPFAFLAWLGPTESFVGRLPKRGDPVTGRLGDMIMRMAPTDPAKPDVMSAGRLFFSPKVVQQLVSDASGRHLLSVAGHALYKWSRGDTKPTKIRGGIVAAAWIPDPPRKHQARLIAAVRTSDGELVILDPRNGATRRELGPLVDASQVTAIPGGRGLLVGVNTAGPCEAEGAPRIDRVDLENGTRTPFANGLFPVINGSGLVAYMTGCDGISVGFTDLKTGAHSRSNPLPGRPRESSNDLLTVLPSAWSPNGRSLLYLVESRAPQGSGYYVGRLLPRRPFLLARVRLPLAATTEWATFVDDGHVATVRWRRGRTEVRVISIARHRESSAFARPLLRFPGRGVRLSVDISGRHFLVLRDDGELLSWRRGDRKPHIVAKGIGAATWMAP